MNVLHICASPKPIDQSASKQLAAAFFAKLAELNPDVDVNNVDLYHNPPPFLSYDAYRYIWQPAFEVGYQPSDGEQKAAGYSRQQVENVRNADVLVLTMPMWNAGMPAIMKAWLDQVMAPSQLFTYNALGTTPLHHIKRIVLLVSSGAVFKENDPNDALTPQINAIASSLTIEDVQMAWADGQDPVLHSDGDLRKRMALEAAQELAEDVASMAQSPA